MEPKKFLLLIKDNKNFTSLLNFNDLIHNSKEEELLLHIIKQIFFFGDQKLKTKNINENMERNEWVDSFVKGEIEYLINEKDIALCYGVIVYCFCYIYDYLKKDFIEFMNEIEKLKIKTNISIFEANICFLCYLNGNNDLMNVILELKKQPLLKKLQICNDVVAKTSLNSIITNYCNLYNIKIRENKNYDKENLTKKKILEQINEMRVYAEICRISKAYKEFILLLCNSLKDLEDLRIGQVKEVSDFIEIIFLILNEHLKIDDYWKEENISRICSDIYLSSFDYCSENFNTNYIDFVLSYISHYKIPSKNFIHYFLKGLNKEGFENAFPNLKLTENIGSINEKKQSKYY